MKQEVECPSCKKTFSVELDPEQDLFNYENILEKERKARDFSPTSSKPHIGVWRNDDK